MICPNCRNEIAENDKFCTECGASTVNTTDRTSPGYGAPASSVTLAPPPRPPKARGGNKKYDNGTMAVLAMVAMRVMLIIAVGIVGVIVWKLVIPASVLKAIPAWSSNVISEDNEIIEDEKISEPDTEEISTEPLTDFVEVSEPDVDADKVFADIDALVKKAEGQISEDAEIVNVMNVLSSAASDYAQKADEAGIASQAANRVENTYSLYVKAVSRHKDIMNMSTPSGSIYAQIMAEFNAACALGDDLAEKGYKIDLPGLEALKEEFDKSYRKRVIDTFDEITTREEWSRTEAWNLVKDTAGTMFDASDLDNPIRRRYAYALSWWLQKQIEEGLKSGIITKKGAAIKIADNIEDMDYNPMMIDYYIRYMKASKVNCASVKTAYNDIVKRIKDTQEIKIGKDIKLSRFWYFNDVAEPGDNVVDGTVNGVTKENREWIRERMKGVEFVH